MFALWKNKLDYLRLELTSRKEIRDCCTLVFTETWLNEDVPDSAIAMEGLTSFRADRSSALSGKSRGGGVYIYINNNWCTNPTTVCSHCSPDIEFLTVKCRPAYLPREFTVAIITAVYIPPVQTQMWHWIHCIAPFVNCSQDILREWSLWLEISIRPR